MKYFLTYLFVIVVFCKASPRCSPQECFGYDPDTVKYVVQYATCANLQTHYKDQIENWTYDPCRLAQSQPGKVTDIKVITNVENYLLAYFAYDSVRNMIVLSFRGTVCGHKFINARVDISFIPKIFYNGKIGGPCRTGSFCKAHGGFYRSYLKLQKQVRDTAEQMVRKYSQNKPKFLVTGISLGGALAALASYDLSLYFKHIGVDVDFIFYTFGQPRIGNKQLIKHIDQEITILRMVYSADPVPHLPPRNLAYVYHFYNPGVEIFIDSHADENP